MEFDVRKAVDDQVTEIIFADVENPKGTSVGYRLAPWPNEDSTVDIRDRSGDNIVIDSAEHARNLIKALQKAIELGWVK